jgi:poly(3-hydroxybutyrate) depolymerase
VRLDLLPGPARRSGLAVVVAVLLASCGIGDPGVDDVDLTEPGATSSPEAGDGIPALEPPEDFTRLPDVVDVSTLDAGESSVAGWQQVVPGVQDVRIRSTADGAEQPALWLPPGGDGPQPLIVVLHSWSAGYEQHANTPFARWADQEGWAVVVPDFRGEMRTPQATASDLAVQDVVDAVDWSLEQGGVDADRVFVVGFSGGGMMSLVMAGRHPDRFAGAVAWVPIHSLEDWYAHNRERSGQVPARYAQEIAASCGGDPTSDPAAQESCASRSPEAHLDAAREAGLPVYIGHGLSDETVPPDHGIRAYDQLADESARLGDDVRRAAQDNRLPDDVPGEPAESFFTGQDPEVLLARRSGQVTLVLFEGGHDAVYHPGLRWMAALAER